MLRTFEIIMLIVLVLLGGEIVADWRKPKDNKQKERLLAYSVTGIMYLVSMIIEIVK